MSAVVFLISIIFFGASAVFSMYRQLQMFQQNSYFLSRYLKWIYESFMYEVTFLCFSYFITTLAFLNNKFFIMLGISAVVLAIRIFLMLKTRKKSIKKLVFTARIKRFIAFLVILLGLFVTAFEVTDGNGIKTVLFSVYALLCLVTPILLCVVSLVTMPIEKLISNYYISDAKRILKQNPDIKVIGITGSFGKTTTKFILNRILSEKYNTVCTPQSFNTPMGVVRTVRESIKPNTQVFICEMGAKKKGDIKEICDIAHPSYGIITSVGAQHLDTFGSIDIVFNTKFELANEIKKNGGTTYISGESEEILKRYNKDDNSLLLFGGESNYQVKNIKRDAFGSNFDLVLDNNVISVSTKLLGLHSIYDILAAATLSYKLGVSENDIKVAVSSLKPTEHRLELKPYINGSLMIDDAYNSNPVGCLEAVRTLGTFENMKKVIVTPGLIELGEKEYEANYALGLEATKYCDIIILVGKNRSKPMNDAISSTDFDKNNVYVVSSFKEAMAIYTPIADKQTVVLIENDLPDNYLN